MTAYIWESNCTVNDTHWIHNKPLFITGTALRLQLVKRVVVSILVWDVVAVVPFAAW